MFSFSIHSAKCDSIIDNEIAAKLKKCKGHQNIDGKEYYFDHLGRQVKGSPISTPKGVEYYESVLGERVTNTWITFQDGKTVFFDENGYADFDK